MRVVGLLRGVNVGGGNRLRMADLLAVVESLGYTDVVTYLQSGNVVFSTLRRSTAGLGDEVRRALVEQCGIDVLVLLRTHREMVAIVAANPYPRDDPTKVVVSFLDNRAVPLDLDLAAFAPEGLTVHGREIYLDLPFGQGRSPLLAALAKVQRDDGTSTARNWRTVLALTELSATSSPT
jgi:uncharacterized protein (DUF1697 family)